jgi:hypothetical protein
MKKYAIAIIVLSMLASCFDWGEMKKNNDEINWENRTVIELQTWSQEIPEEELKIIEDLLGQ